MRTCLITTAIAVAGFIAGCSDGSQSNDENPEDAAPRPDSIVSRGDGGGLDAGGAHDAAAIDTGGPADDAGRDGGAAFDGPSNDSTPDADLGDARASDAELDMAGEDMAGEDMAGEDMAGEDMASDGSLQGDALPDAADVDGALPGACAAPVVAPRQCLGLCGNGVRDQCPGDRPRIVAPPWDAGVPPPIFEDCDGAQLGGATCQGLGFVGGDLACGDNCRFDPRSCSFCLPHERVVACRRATEVLVRPRHMSLALADRVAVAWVATTEQGDQGQGSAVFFQSYSAADLSPLDRSCLGPGGDTGVALAATDRGWLLAAVTNGQIAVRPLDLQGQVVGQGLAVAGRQVGLTPTLAGIAMTWTGADAASYLSLLDDRGGELWRTRVFDSEGGRASLVQVGDAFLMAQATAAPAPGGQLHRGVVVANITTEGVLLGVTFPAPPSTEYPSLATNGAQVRLTYADFSGQPELHWVALDAAGRPQARARLGQRPWFNPAPAKMFGADTVVLIGAYTGTTDHASELLLARFDAAGAPLGAPLVINRDPNQSSFWQLQIAGDDVVLAWIESGHGVGLARVRP